MVGGSCDLFICYCVFVNWRNSLLSPIIIFFREVCLFLSSMSASKYVYLNIAFKSLIFMAFIFLAHSVCCFMFYITIYAFGIIEIRCVYLHNYCILFDLHISGVWLYLRQFKQSNNLRKDRKLSKRHFGAWIMVRGRKRFNRIINP